MTEPVILLVEDNPQDEWLALRALRRSPVPHRVDVVRDGQQALDYLFCEADFAGREGPALPTVVLLDIGLPRLTGLEVVARLRADERTRLLPVVMLTSSDDAADRLDSHRLGANRFVRKPLSLDDLGSTVSGLGPLGLATHEPPSQPS